MTTMAMAAAGRVFTFAACTLLLCGVGTHPVHAQTAGEDDWRLSAAVGGFVPRAAIIVGADGRDTRLGAGPSFSLELQYMANSWAAFYGNASAGFTTITLGTDVVPAAVGSAEQTTVFTGTAGVVLSPSALLLSDRVQPTLRLGGGLKSYFVDVDGADNQFRPTADIGIGFRGIGTGPIEVSAEVRYLPSSFDQSALPTRGIAPQDQRQTDLLFTIGFAIRP